MENKIKDNNPIIIYAAGGVAAPLREICDNFAKLNKIEFKFYFGPGRELTEIIEEENNGDIVSFGADFFSDLLEDKKLIKKENRYSIGFRELSILIKKENPVNIVNLDSLSNENMRIGIAYDGCLAGINESLFLSHNPAQYNSFKDNIVFHSHSCGKLVNSLIQDKVDAIIGWNTFKEYSRDKISVIKLPAEKQILRTTNISILNSSKNPDIAQEIIDYIKLEKNLRIYEKHGWKILNN